MGNLEREKEQLRRAKIRLRRIQHYEQVTKNVSRTCKSDPVSWDTELARMSVTKEAGHGDEAEEAGAGAIQYPNRV